MKMKKNRHFRTLVCLALGLVLLTGSAYANYDNANGYNLYKKGLKNFLTTENFSVDGTMEMLYNGEVVETAEITYMYDRNGDTSEYSRAVDSDGSVSQSWIQGDTRINWNNYGGKASWHTGTAWDKGFNDDYLSSSKEDREMVDKMVNFMELMADTFVGDLKNNFVLTNSESGSMSYQVNLQGQQIPSLVNAGLSLLFSSQNYYNSDYAPSYVTFEDYSILDEDGELDHDYYEMGWQVLNDKGGSGVAVVMKDGSISYYPTEQEYYDAMGYDFTNSFSGDIFNQLGSDPVIESANCYLTVDKDGNLTQNTIDGTLSGYDASGNKHSYTIRVSLNFYDYGTTKIAAVDPDALEGEKYESSGWQWNMAGDGEAEVVIDEELDSIAEANANSDKETEAEKADDAEKDTADADLEE